MATYLNVSSSTGRPVPEASGCPALENITVPQELFRNADPQASQERLTQEVWDGAQDPGAGGLRASCPMQHTGPGIQLVLSKGKDVQDGAQDPGAGGLWASCPMPWHTAGAQ